MSTKSNEGLGPSRCSTFTQHRDTTVSDLESVAAMLSELISHVKQGDMKAFERFWIEGGTEEGDARIFQVREILLLRYMVRDESVTAST